MPSTVSRRQALIPLAGIATGAAIGMPVVPANLSIKDPVSVILDQYETWLNLPENSPHYDEPPASIRNLDCTLAGIKPTTREGALQVLRWLYNELDAFNTTDDHLVILRNATEFLSA